MRFLGDLRRPVVAYVRRQRSDQHQRSLKQLADARFVGLDAARAMLLEGARTVAQQPRALQEGMDDQRLVHVELEVPRCSAEVERRIVAQNLGEYGRASCMVRMSYCGYVVQNC